MNTAKVASKLELAKLKTDVSDMDKLAIEKYNKFKINNNLQIQNRNTATGTVIGDGVRCVFSVLII